MYWKKKAPRHLMTIEGISDLDCENIEMPDTVAQPHALEEEKEMRTQTFRPIKKGGIILIIPFFDHMHTLII